MGQALKRLLLMICIFQTMEFQHLQPEKSKNTEIGLAL